MNTNDPALIEMAMMEQPCAFHRAIRGAPCYVKGPDEDVICGRRIRAYQHTKAPPADGPERHAGGTPDQEAPRG